MSLYARHEYSQNPTLSPPHNKERPTRTSRRASQSLISNPQSPAYSTTTRSVPLRPKTSGEYISSALVGGTMNVPGVVARATYV